MNSSQENNHDDTQSVSRFRRIMQSSLRAVALLTILGLTLRLTVRDSILGFSTLYYMTPLALIVVGAGVGFLNSLLKKNLRHTVFWALLLILVSIWWKDTEWKSHHSKTETVDDIVVLLANIARDQDLDYLIEIVEDVDPDLIVFIEALAVTEEQKQDWRQKFPDYNWSLIGGGTQLFSKGTVGPPWVKPQPDGTRISRSELNIRGHAFHCFVVDIASTLFLSRAPALRELTDFVENSKDENVIILGDFNTPRDSVHFSELRRNCVNLCETVGQSYAATWPQPLPVLSLDQIWVNEKIEPVSCNHRYNENSDHRIVVGRFRVKILPSSSEGL